MGKKLYQTSLLNVFRLVVLVVVIFFTNNFYLETFTQEKFQIEHKFKLIDVLQYHYKYPQEAIIFFLVILAPAVYYSFIRGIRFYEKGLVFNRGLPFLNRPVLYSEIETYKLLHTEFAISVHTPNGEAFVVADNNINRVIGILDQHGIKSDLASDEFARLISNYRKFIYILLGFTALLFLMRKIGLI
jgi:hypothetical protein